MGQLLLYNPRFAGRLPQGRVVESQQKRMGGASGSSSTLRKVQGTRAPFGAPPLSPAATPGMYSSFDRYYHLTKIFKRFPPRVFVVVIFDQLSQKRTVFVARRTRILAPYISRCYYTTVSTILISELRW